MMLRINSDGFSLSVSLVERDSNRGFTNSSVGASSTLALAALGDEGGGGGADEALLIFKEGSDDFVDDKFEAEKTFG